MEEEKLYEEVKCIILIETTKALCIKLMNGRFEWIPISLISNLSSVNIYDKELEVILEVEKWFVDKIGLQDNGWT